jgi:molecular chaperone GrpE
MADEFQSDDERVDPAAADSELFDEVPLDIAFVVPAAAYDYIDTDDELTRPLERRAELEPPGHDGSAALQAIDALGEGLHRKLDALQSLFEREIRAEATREKVVDRLHAELQEYKQDLLLNVLRPVFVDLIQLHDDIGKIADAQPEGAGEVRRLLDLMRGFQQGIEDILYRQGVEPYAEPGDSFDPRRQRAVATVPTDDPAANKKIAARHRKGFQAGDKVIRPEVVSVFAQRKASD